MRLCMLPALGEIAGTTLGRENLSPLPASLVVFGEVLRRPYSMPRSPDWVVRIIWVIRIISIGLSGLSGLGCPGCPGYLDYPD